MLSYTNNNKTYIINGKVYAKWTNVGLHTISIPYSSFVIIFCEILRSNVNTKYYTEFCIHINEAVQYSYTYTKRVYTNLEYTNTPYVTITNETPTSFQIEYVWTNNSQTYGNAYCLCLLNGNFGRFLKFATFIFCRCLFVLKDSIL